MAIDTSTVLAILPDEPDRRACTERIEAAATRADSRWATAGRQRCRVLSLS